MYIIYFFRLFQARKHNVNTLKKITEWRNSLPTKTATYEPIKLLTIAYYYTVESDYSSHYVEAAVVSLSVFYVA